MVLVFSFDLFCNRNAEYQQAYSVSLHIKFLNSVMKQHWQAISINPRRQEIRMGFVRDVRNIAALFLAFRQC